MGKLGNKQPYLRQYLIIVTLLFLFLFCGLTSAISLSGISSSYYVGDKVSFHAEETVAGKADTYNYCEFILYEHWDGPLSSDTEGNHPYHFGKSDLKNIKKGTVVKLDWSFDVVEEMLEGKSEDAGEFQVHVYCDSSEWDPQGSKSWNGSWKIKTWTAKKKEGCSSNSDCGSYEVCNNSKCVEVECKKDSQCPSDLDVGSPECNGNTVQQKYKDYYCADAGKTYANCDYDYEYKTTQDCGVVGCSNGKCNPKPNCSSKAECGTDSFIGNPLCQNGDVMQDYITYACNFPGTANAFCSNSTQNKIVKDCVAKEICDNAQCKTVACAKNSDCGTDIWIGVPSCKNGHVYQQKTEYSCNNAGQLNASCSNNVIEKKKQDCGSKGCINGACIVCNSNTDCGINGYEGNPFCSNNSVYQKFVTYACNNPGTANASCLPSSGNNLVKDCQVGETCESGVCNTCKINTAYWSTNSVKGGTSVTMTASTTNCNGQKISFSIYEDDPIGNDFILTKEAVVSNGSAKLNWTAQYFADWWADPEFFFKATTPGNSSKTSGDLKVTAGGFINLSEFEEFFLDEPVIIVKGTNLSQELEGAITELEKTAEEENGNVTVMTAAPEADSCYISGISSASLIIIGNENNNKAYACSSKDADEDSGMYFQESPWSDEGEFGIIWVNTKDSDGAYDNIIALDKMFSMGVNDNMNLWDSSVACIWDGDFEKAASPFKEELTCNVIPIVELAPDARDVWHYCTKSLKGTIGKKITEWDADAYLNNFMCRFVVGMFALDVGDLPVYLTIIGGFGEVVGDTAVSAFKISMKGFEQKAFGDVVKKGMLDLALKVSHESPKLMQKMLPVIQKAPKLGEDMAEAVVKTFSHGKDVAEKAINYMSKDAWAGWTPKAVEGMGYLYKMDKETIKITLDGTSFSTKLYADNANKIVANMFVGGNYENEIKAVRKALGSESNKKISIAFGDVLSNGIGTEETQYGLTWLSPTGMQIFLKGKKYPTSLNNADYEFVLRRYITLHELAEEQQILQIGKALDKYDIWNGFNYDNIFTNNKITEHFAESLMIKRVGFGKGTIYADALDFSVKELITAGDIATVAVTKKNLGYVAEEYATAIKIGNAKYADDLILKMKEVLKQKYPKIKDSQLTTAVTKVKAVSEEISKVGDAIADNPPLIDGTPELAKYLDDLQNQVKSLDLKPDLKVDDIDIFNGSVKIDALVSNVGLDSATNVGYALMIDDIQYASGSLSLGPGEEAHIVKTFNNVSYGPHYVELIFDAWNKVEEENEKNNSKQEPFSYSVNGINTKPKINVVDYNVVYAGEKAIIKITAEDNDVSSLKYSISSDYFFLTGNEFSWQTALQDAGTYDLNVTASDNEFADTVQIILQVLCPEGKACSAKSCSSNSDCLNKEVCYDNKCANAACIMDSDCEAYALLGESFCDKGDVYQAVPVYTCNNANKPNAYCSSKMENKLKTECSQQQLCDNGECKDIACNTDLDCGTDEYLGEPFCDGTKIYKKYKTYDCINGGKLNASCSSTLEDKWQNSCWLTQKCVNGQCENACSKNSDCGNNEFIGTLFCDKDNVYQNYVSHTCTNPATPYASCSTTIIDKLKTDCAQTEFCDAGECKPIACFKNSDCGNSGMIEMPFCKGDNVYQQYKTNYCINPGKFNAQCTSSLNDFLIEKCLAGKPCSNGACQFACYEDADCGTKEYSAPFCNGNNIYQQYAKFTCSNPGTSNAKCSSAPAVDLIANCSSKQLCSNGSCQDVACVAHSDCGITGYTGTPICTNGDVYQDYVTNQCLNAGKLNASCSSTKKNVIAKDCLPNEFCDAGECKPIACSKNSDCGKDGWIEEPLCDKGDVYKQYKTYFCNTPGKFNALCSSKTENKVFEDCKSGKTCFDGKCQTIACTQDSDCGIGNWLGISSCSEGDVYQQFKGHACLDAGTPSANCIVIFEDKMQTDCLPNELCVNAECKPVECFSDSDCHSPIPTGKSFCYDGDAYQLYINATCVNAGTLNAKCSDSVDKKIITDCTQSQLCNDGACVNTKCKNNSDCGTDGLIENTFCKDNAVYQPFKKYVCNNPGTLNAACSESIIHTLLQSCGSSLVCSTGKCISIQCHTDADCTKEKLFGKYIPSWAMSPFIQFICQNLGTANAKCISKTVRPQTISQTVIQLPKQGRQ